MPQTSQVDSTLAPAGLQAALKAAFPGALLVPAWVLREFIVHDRRGDEPGTFVPRRHFHLIERDRAEALAERERLPIDGMEPDAAWLVLLPRPDSEWLASTPAPLALRSYWRRLFRARVTAEIRGRLGLPGAPPIHLAPRVLCEQLKRLGRAGMHEVRQVLHEERLVPARAADPDVYADFVAVFLELFYFDRRMLRRYFPALPDEAMVMEWMGETLDAEGLWRQTRLTGAAGPPAEPEPCDDGHDETGGLTPTDRESRDEQRPPEPNKISLQSSRKQDALLTAADRATARGNDVRAAVLHAEAFQLGGSRAGINYAGRDLDALTDRLASIREIGDCATAWQWRQVLRPILASVGRQWWDQQARLLYDLQKVCVENEREVFSVNLVEWALDLGRRPLRRPVPRQRLVLMVKHLHSAQRRMTHLRLAPPVRLKLNAVLTQATHAAESHLREQLYPVVLSALQASGLQPHSLAEAVAENKLVEELLDTLARKGFLSLGDLRDAVSRNAMKLDDLRDGREFIRGDQLLRIDRKLAVELDGVYRRGEIYRRSFQRFSSLLFADKLGRGLTRTLLIPLGGAFLVLEGLEHTIGLLIHLIFKVHLELGAGIHLFPEHPELMHGWKAPGLKLWVDHPFRYLAVAALFFLLANWPAFRAAAGHFMRKIGRALHWMFIGFPSWVMSRPIVRAIARSPALRLGMRYIVKPLIFAGVAWLVLPRSLGVVDRAALGGGAFLAANLLLNSRRIRALEGVFFHRLRIGWEKLTGNILAGLYRMVMGFFERVLEDIDRMLYQVDEWLRFHSGQGKAAFAAKALLGVGWFYVAYFTRFVINLLVEPQINPIKHFPVVTVSHKIILPQAKLLSDAFEALGLAPARAVSLALPIIFLIPGMFGFLAWELLSNWKLYQANRPATLRPVQVGSHGESLARLLRPGIHSGTIPKIFARLRRTRSGPSRRAHKLHHALEHVREAVEHFLERELVQRLNRHPAWESAPIALGEVTLTPTSIVAELLCPALDRPGPGALPDSAAGPMLISFRNFSGWIVAGIDRAGWVAEMNQIAASDAGTAQSTAWLDKAALLSLALAGLYQRAGVDLVREQTDAVLSAAFAVDSAAGSPSWDIRQNQLLVWPDGQARDGEDIAVVYALAEGVERPKMLSAQTSISTGRGATPPVDTGKLLLRHTPIGWNAWVNAWEPGASPEACAAAINGARVLPDLPPRHLSEVAAV